jgi:predicted alpha/beta hydrolase family esterase
MDFSPAPRQPLPFPTILVASRNDPYASFDTASGLAEAWGSQLVDVGRAGHINAESGLGIWEQGVALLETLLTSTTDARRTVRARRERMQAPYPQTRPDRAGDFAR